ncbi:Uncharacterised protein [Achromobacter sp. 2789STDY5608633]|nr:Uncharacterised protein [Achromobacter sp. 2789STDY5608633]
MDLLMSFLLKMVLPFLLGYYGMKVWYWFQDRRAK